MTRLILRRLIQDSVMEAEFLPRIRLFKPLGVGEDRRPEVLMVAEMSIDFELDRRHEFTRQFQKKIGFPPRLGFDY